MTACYRQPIQQVFEEEEFKIRSFQNLQNSGYTRPWSVQPRKRKSHWEVKEYMQYLDSFKSKDKDIASRQTMYHNLIIGSNEPKSLHTNGTNFSNFCHIVR